MNDKELLKFIARLEEQIDNLSQTLKSFKRKIHKNLEETELSPNCPKCGRHDFGLYNLCPSCDSAEYKTKLSFKTTKEYCYLCGSEELDSHYNCKFCDERIIKY